MNTDTVNKWLTLSANIGVVIGLMLLIVEIDQNSELVKAQINQARSDSLVQRLAEFADSEHIAPLRAKLNSAGYPERVVPRNELTPVEVERLQTWLGSSMLDFENLFYQYQLGFIDQEYWEARIVPAIKTFGPYREAYGGVMGRADFLAEVRRILDEAE